MHDPVSWGSPAIQIVATLSQTFDGAAAREVLQRKLQEAVALSRARIEGRGIDELPPTGAERRG